ncbi:hypothetical protein B0A52_05658 [Exophiala mesophila]|uniref:BD-FAE-like domain-containing protein n=1 Tax=Exophiala mesophila TaxID=212818 RepID=A0A438N2M9_EXOME|nr:hypothetical protein B0A52_05658 [Exophiala mesophila]
MDKLPAFGRDVFAASAPTFQIFGDLLRRPERLALLNSIPREVHRFGQHERQTLDLYRSSHKGQPRSIFIFIHGGANVSGGSIAPEIEGEVVYKGLGYFLAEELGYDAIIINYRLLQHGAVFNTGGEDLDLVISWVEENLCLEGEKRDMVVMGNSAGGLHLASWLFDEAFTSSTQRVLEPSAKLHLRRAIILSTTMLADPDNEFVAPMVPNLLRYYKTRENIVKNAPLNLMRRKFGGRSVDKDGSSTILLPHLLLVATEYDPIFLIETEKTLMTEWKELGGQAEYWELQGHNHLSPPLALGTGDKAAETWGFELAKRLSDISQ